MNRTLPGPAGDIALLLTRLLLGTIMFAHGYQKLMINGLGRTTQGFESMSIPAAIFSAAFVTVVEIVGGVLVIVGALLTVVAFCYLIVMVGAAVFVHIPNGIFVQNGGWELVGAIAALLLALAAAGSGRYGVDDLLRRRQAHAAASAGAAVSATAPTEVMAVPAPRDRPLAAPGPEAPGHEAPGPEAPGHGAPGHGAPGRGAPAPEARVATIFEPEPPAAAPAAPRPWSTRSRSALPSVVPPAATPGPAPEREA